MTASEAGGRPKTDDVAIMLALNGQCRPIRMNVTRLLHIRGLLSGSLVKHLGPLHWIWFRANVDESVPI